jgi:hypothetical protein
LSHEHGALSLTALRACGRPPSRACCRQQKSPACPCLEAESLIDTCRQPFVTFVWAKVLQEERRQPCGRR